MIKPQLARPFRDGKDEWLWVSPQHIGETKFDGFRSIVEGERFVSRKGKEFDPMFPMDLFPPKGKVDGELIVRPGLGLPQGHSEVGHWLSADPSKLMLVLFDCIADVDGRNIQGLSWEVRRETLEYLFSTYLSGYERVGLSKIRMHKKKELYDDTIACGGEGVVLKDVTRPYEQGSRSAWVKKKAWDPVDVVITDCDAKPSEWRVKPGEFDKQTGLVLPDGDHTEPWKLGYVGLSYGFFDQHGKLRTVGSTGVTGPRAEMLPYVGMVASFKCFGKQRPTGALNHPVFLEWRDDKPAEDCVFEFED